MFSGIVGTVGVLRRVTERNRVRAFEIEAPALPDGTKEGDSVAVNGVCLTVETIRTGGIFTVSVSEQTVRETTLGTVKPGDRFNLESALRMGDPIGGHLMTGHVDFTAPVVTHRTVASLLVEIRVPGESARYFVRRGSAGVDGISLTVADIKGPVLSFWIIPFTLRHTTLPDKKVGETVNVEIDFFAKYVERMVGRG